MKTFLQAVAHDVFERYGDNLSRTAVIFPGKRAGLWFDRYLYKCAGHPMWSPAYITIDELFCSMSSLNKESPIRTICMLHKVYCQLTGSTEPLDDFYYWGELMLSDFDDLDKNCVDADSLFVNLADIKQLDNRFDYLTPEQKQLLSRFFSGLQATEQQTEIKKRFIKLWQVMGSIYKELRATLHAQSTAYEGMLYRDAMENYSSSLLSYDHYVVVGFNVLNRVEQQLFDCLKESGKALFYWDYDRYYYENTLHEAGTFVRENIVRYGNALSDDTLFDNFKHLPEITCISAPTDNAQARYLHTWVSDHITEHEEETAIVLCNEDIAQTVLHAIPSDKVQNVNITMGMKLTQTSAYTLVATYLKLHTKGYDDAQGIYMFDHVSSLLSHPLIYSLYPEAKVLLKELTESKRIYIASDMESIRKGVLHYLFVHPTDNKVLLDTLTTLISEMSRVVNNDPKTDSYLTQLGQESLFQIHRIIENFKSLIADGTLNIRTKTLVHFMQRVMSPLSIPFHGEPAIGLQVMGVLETRNLDFRHIVLLSTNEGKLPKGSNEVSFIPYNIREIFGMTTLQRKNAVYAYYFYRMIQRAQHLTIIYNNGTDGLNKQEPSRYIMQLQVEFPGKLTMHDLQSASRPNRTKSITIEQTADTRHKLQEHFRYTQDQSKQHRPIYRLSPSTLNDYLDCRLRFYLKHIEGLTPPESSNADVDVAALGTIFHKSAELAYDKLTERTDTITRDDIDTLLNDEHHIQAFVDEAFRTEFFHTDPDMPLHYNGTQLIVRHVICSYMRQLLLMDQERCPFRYIQSEKRIRQVHHITSHGTPLDILLGGTIDRIDSKTDASGREITRILDYKTGGSQKTIKSVDDLFQRDKPRDNYVFQAFYYAYLMNNDYKCIAPTLLFVRNTSDATFEPHIVIDKHPVDDFSIYQEQFSQRLNETIEEIFNSDVPYDAATNPDACTYCKFTSLCKK